MTTLLLPLPVDDRYRHLMVPRGPHRELVDVPVRGFTNPIGNDLGLHLLWNDRRFTIPVSRTGSRLTVSAQDADKNLTWAPSANERVHVCLWIGLARLLADEAGHDLLLAAIDEWDHKAAAHPNDRPASERRAAALAAAMRTNLPEHMYGAIMSAANDWDGSAADLVAAFTAATDHQR